MAGKIIIEHPCMADWNAMRQVNGHGRHCEACQLVVVDFRKKPACDIEAYFEKPGHRDTCGLYEQRHTNHATRWEKALNRIESVLPGSRTKRTLALLISGILFISGCARRVQGRLNAYSFDDSKKSPKHHQKIKKDPNQ